MLQFQLTGKGHVKTESCCWFVDAQAVESVCVFLACDKNKQWTHWPRWSDWMCTRTVPKCVAKAARQHQNDWAVQLSKSTRAKFAALESQASSKLGWNTAHENAQQTMFLCSLLWVNNWPSALPSCFSNLPEFCEDVLSCQVIDSIVPSTGDTRNLALIEKNNKKSTCI